MQREFPEFDERQIEWIQVYFTPTFKQEDSADTIRWKAAQIELVNSIVDMQLERNVAKARAVSQGKQSPLRGKDED